MQAEEEGAASEAAARLARALAERAWGRVESEAAVAAAVESERAESETAVAATPPLSSGSGSVARQKRTAAAAVFHAAKAARLVGAGSQAATQAAAPAARAAASAGTQAASGRAAA